MTRRSASDALMLLVFAAFVILSMTLWPLSSANAQTSAKIAVDPEARSNYLALSSAVDQSRLSRTISVLTGIHYDIPTPTGGPAIVAYSRLAGTPGGDQARDYVRSQFDAIFGATNVHDDKPFDVTVPMDRGAAVVAGGRSYPLRPLWPNLVRTSTLPAAGVDGLLIYGGHGDLRSFRGQRMEGSIVMLDFNCGTQWLNAARLGARAIIFVEPTETMRGEAEAKFIGIPVDIPRFWISRTDAASLQSAALTTPNFVVHLDSNNPWETHQTSNIVGVIPGTDPILKTQIVVIESYYDSMSVVPTLAPGAETTCGIASMLELARIYKLHPPKRTVWFVACAAHFLGLQGARTYIDDHLEQWQSPSGWDRFASWVTGGARKIPDDRQNVALFSGLDLSSQTSTVGVFYKGYFYDCREDIGGQFSDLGRVMRENAAKIGAVLGLDPDTAFADGINGLNGKSWRNYLPAHFAFDAEAATMAGGNGITFANTDDARQASDTPFDTPDHVNIANLARQTRFLACEYWDLLNDTNDADSVPADSAKSVMPVANWPAWTRQGLRLGYCRIKGRVLEYDPIKNFVPDEPIIGSLAVVDNPAKTMVCVRGNLIQAVGPAGNMPSVPDSRFDFVGLPLVISNSAGLMFADQTIHIGAYHTHDVDDATSSRGDIDYAPDQGSEGGANYPTSIVLNSDTRQTQVIVFPCVATSIFDLVDQQSLKALTGVRVLDGVTDGEPRQYGFILAGIEPGVSYVEDVAVLFSVRSPDTRLKVLMDSGAGATRFLLINSLPPNPALSQADNQRNAQGLGYAVGVPSPTGSADNSKPPDPNDPSDVVRNGGITDTALRVAEDMWNLDEFRIDQLAQFRIVNDNLHNDKKTGLHDIAHDYILKAQDAYRRLDYDAFDADSRQAWAFEARVYPQAQATANDVVAGVIFYLFLLLPFAFFVERLVVGSTDLKTQLSWSFGIFLAIFLLFSSVHPAFKITINPIIVLIAFVMLALSVIVSLVVWGKFEEQLKSFSKTVTGTHKAEVGKASVAFAAFALGISNMRRRKERTFLTCITLVLLTFTVLSFTSIVDVIRTNDVPAPGVAGYNGILLRLPTWEALQDPAYQLLSDEYGRNYPVAPRAWFFGAAQGQQTFLHVTHAEQGIDVKGVVGFTPEEAAVTHADQTLTAGRWFNRTDTYSAMIPQGMADSLGIDASQVGKVDLNFSGVPYLVVGIFDPDKFKALKDLDNEPLTPVDYAAQASQNPSSSAGGGASAASQGFTEYQHLDPNNVLIIPYDTMINMGGTLRSVAINFGTAATADRELRQLIKRLDLNIYEGADGRNHRFSAIGGTQSQGLINIVIPILIAALIVLNTMLGSVFERVKEIAIFSSIGLSPSNIAMLFIAEAVVYAIIGAVSGYLIGQVLSKVISTFNLLPGLYLNFSSTSAELSIGLVILVVLLSTIFPARKASEVATPAVDRAWRVPDPDGDVWKITLPFAVAGSQATGINQFLAEWFQSYEEQSVGDFLTQGIKTGAHETESGPGYRLTGRVWLAPFDLGVSQDIDLDTVPTDLEDIYAVHLTLTRVSGDVSNWKRINRRFLNVVRKQFLIWRTLSAEERDRYLAAPVEPEPQTAPPAAVPAMR